MFTNIKISVFLSTLSLSFILGAVPVISSAASGYGGPYNFGTPASAADIAMIDIDAMPDGRGLPSGSGNYQTGKEVYTAKCLACHGADLAGVKGTGAAALIGGRGSLASGKPKKTVESYWPYASTVFDYVKRAMPFNAPGSLSDDEVYAVVAYVLGEANIFDRSASLNAKSLPMIDMPNKDGFISDPRPDVFNYE
ncbi:MAG: mono/diheme cytochrome c family protein [Urechidicola sp.]|jgi:mono/diheme cytochrome c family protein